MKKVFFLMIFLTNVAFSRPTTFNQYDTIQVLKQGTMHMAQGDIYNDGDCG